MSDSFSTFSGAPYRFIDRFSSEYPKRLNEIKDPPAGIYVKGELPDENAPSVAIVGSRICSQYGRIAAANFGEYLAKHGVSIISGLARGIDGISQNAAADSGGKSYGILGCGINVVYPLQNKSIYENVLINGGIISEFSPDAPPKGINFALRNRIISALSDIVLVIEAKEKSGTQITVNRALEQGKDIYALPGRVTDICSAGCNKLISQGAGIAYSPDAILHALGIIPASSKEKSTGSILLEPLEKRIFSILDFYPTGLNALSLKSSLPLTELTNILFHLQIKGLVKEVSKNMYIKTKEI